MIKFIFIVVYFGPLPFWMSAFLRSCQMNPTVEWLLFTDSPRPVSAPSNVRFIYMDLNTFNKLSSNKLELDVRVLPSFLYKLTDYKPSYGKIFEDYVQGYDFWGHCDIDVVWGDIRKFINDHILSDYDIITSRPMKISGHCCLYRNNDNLRNLYKDIPNVANMLQQSDKHFSVGEKQLNPYLRSIVYPSTLKKFLHHFKINKKTVPNIFWERHLTTPGRQQLNMAKEGKCFRWRSGKAFDENNNELMYIHFHKIRKSLHTINFNYNDQVDEFIITQDGFFAS